MYIERLKLDGYKCFKREKLDLGLPDPANDLPLSNITVLLGVNGAGKSSLLQAIVISILGDELRESGWVPRNLRQAGMSEDQPCRIDSDLQFHEQDELEAESGSTHVRIHPRGAREKFTAMKGPAGYVEHLYQESTPTLFLAAYGTGRRVETGSTFDEGRRHHRYTARFQRVGSLFHEDFELTPLSAWWLEAGSRRAELQQLFKHLVPELDMDAGLGDVPDLPEVLAGLYPTPESMQALWQRAGGTSTLVMSDGAKAGWQDLIKWSELGKTGAPTRSELLRAAGRDWSRNKTLQELSAHELSEGDLVVRFRNVALPLSALSDGYRSFVGWVGDLLYRLHRVCPPSKTLDSVAGVVLVDELDLHLHPDWQRQVVHRLSAALPRLQFIVTTHSPLVVGTVHQHNLRLLQPQGSATRILAADVDPFGLSADQILLSETFGLSSVREQGFTDRLDEVRQEAEAGDLDASMRYTRMLALGAAGDQ